jgi:hypothetical protein
MPEKTSPINDLKPNRFPRKKGLTGNRPNKVKEISEENSNDMTDYPIGDGKEYPSNSNMPRIKGILPPGFQEPQEIKNGGLIELKKGKDYIKDLI